jgi:hypothetical protein
VVIISEIWLVYPKMRRYNRNYVIKHERIVNKLKELVAQREYGCVPVSMLAKQLKTDERTVRAHLRIMQIHGLGVFNDSREKEFCTPEGILQLAEKVGLKCSRTSQEETICK